MTGDAPGVGADGQGPDGQGPAEDGGVKPTGDGAGSGGDTGTGGDTGGGAMGGTWTEESAPEATSPLTGVWGSGLSDVSAVGYSGTLLHWNGSAWSDLAGVTTANLYGVWGTSNTNAWAVGVGDSSGDFNATILQWNGSAWSSVDASAASGGLASIWGSGANDVYAVGDPEADDAAIIHWDGSSWQQVSADRYDLSALRGMGERTR
jgi:hypothetical protein